MNFVSGIPMMFAFVMSTGGPEAAFANWTMVGGFSFIVSLAMAEIASALPVAGGIYYWSFYLGGQKWGPFLSWMTAVRLPLPGPCIQSPLMIILAVVELGWLDNSPVWGSTRRHQFPTICSRDPISRCRSLDERMVCVDFNISRDFDCDAPQRD
jgi:amino acid transporter